MIEPETNPDRRPPSPSAPSTLSAMTGVALRRLIADRTIVTSTAILVAIGMVQLAAAPIYTAAVSVGALRWSVTTAPAEQSVVTAELSTAPETLAAIDPVVLGELQRSLAGVSSEVSRRLASGSFALPDQPSEERTDLTVLASVTGMTDRVSVVAGTWPQSSGADGPIPATVEEGVADRLGLAVGDAVDLVARRGGGSTRVEIVGHYRIDDRTDRFWTGQPLLRAGVLDAPSFRTLGPLVVDENDLVAGRAGRVTVDWLADPELDRITTEQAERLARSLSRFPDRLDEAVAGLDPDITRRIGGLDSETGLPTLLVDSTRSVTVSRAGVLALSAQLTVLAGLALALGARQLWDARRDQTALLLARGGGRGHLVALAAVEAVVLVVPAALAAPALAVLALRALGRWGPLSSIGFPVEPEVGAIIAGPVAVAALAMIAILVLPAARSPRVLEPVGRNRRQGRGAAVAGVGLDVALAVVTVAALWQLGRLGRGARSVVGDRFGVDPLLVVAPALALATGAVLTLRLIPLLVRSAEGLVDRTRSVVGALAGWQVARRPAEQARSVFLLALALAIGGFGAAHAATWRASQADQADQLVGAAVRVFPDRRSGQAIDPLHLVSAHRSLDGVQAVVPVTRAQGSLPASTESAVFLALDAEAGPAVIQGRNGGLAEAMAAIGSARPRWTGLAVPEGAVELSVEVTAIEEPILVEVAPEPEADDPPPEDADERAEPEGPAEREEPVLEEPVLEPLPPVFDGWLDVLVQDADGLLHRLELGRLTSGSEPITLTVELNDDGRHTGSSDPLTIVGLEIRLPVPAPPARRVELLVTSLTASDGDGATTEIELIDPSTTWRASASSPARLNEPPQVALGGGLDESDDRTAPADQGELLISLVTGSVPSFFGAAQPLALFELGTGHRDRPDALPVAVEGSWLAATGTEIGDRIDLPAYGLADRPAEVVATTDGFPTIDPAEELVVLTDLATLQTMTYEAGRRVAVVDELWLGVTPSSEAPEADSESNAAAGGGSGREALVAALAGPPFSSAALQDRDAVEAGLRTDPVALTPIAAYTIGTGAALALAVVVFATGAALSSRLRRPELMLLRALGLSPGQIARWLAVEHLIQIVIAAVSGLVVGLALSIAILPRLAVDREGRPILPVPRTVIPWDTVALVGLLPLAALALILLVQVRTTAAGTGVAELRGDGG